MAQRSSSGRPHHEEAKKKRRNRWIFITCVLVTLVVAGAVTYRFARVRRADRFAAAGDSLRKDNKLNDAAIQYRVALQLDPHNYYALSGAARLASQADRPEAIELWQKVVELPQCSVQDREEYAELLIRSNRLTLAQNIIDPLLKNNPDTRTLELASRYSTKTGERAKAVEFMRIAAERSPEDDGIRLQLAELLAQSTNSTEQAEARKILWELAGKSNSNAYKQVAIEALAGAPQLTADEQARLVQELASLTPKTVKDDLLAADLRLQLHPDDASQLYREVIERWRDAPTEELFNLPAG